MKSEILSRMGYTASLSFVGSSGTGVEPGSGLYRTILVVEVLSENSAEDLSLAEVAHAIVNGGASGEVECVLVQELSKRRMAQALQDQASDASFLLGDDGWKYSLHNGDQVRIGIAPNDERIVTVRTIEYADNGAVAINTVEGEHIETTIDELQ